MAQRIVPHKTSRPPRPVSLPRRRCSASSRQLFPFFFWRDDKALIKESTHARQIYPEPARVDPGARQNNSPGP